MTGSLIQRFLEASITEFSRGPGKLAERTVEILRTTVTVPNTGCAALTRGDQRSPVPPELATLLTSAPITPCLDTVRDIHGDFDWYRSGRWHTPYTLVVGPAGRVHHDQICMGLFLLPPRHLYPNHLHGADEVYVVLAGSGEWSLAGQAFVQKVASDIIEVPSMTDHALRTATAPLLTLWSWTGDISYDRYQFTGSASG